MKILLPPKPAPTELVTLIEKSIVQNISPVITDEKKRYVHWDKIRHLTPPRHFQTIEEYWFFIKFSRANKYEKLPFVENFVYVLSSEIQESLHKIDSMMHGIIDTKINVNKRHYITRSLIEESMSSSQIEGAATTRVVAKEMLQTQRKPKDYSEQMIYNNYQAMQLIEHYKNDDITPAIIREIHRIITENTLKNPEDAGRLRQDNNVYVAEEPTGNTLHVPPDYQELPKRLEILCNFINNQSDNTFLHPVLRAIITHFVLAYDHPFVDGNGRTARALFYLTLLKNQYWLFSYISISKYILQAKTSYGKSFLEVETDDLDVTYFILSQLHFINQAITDLFAYIDKEQYELTRALDLLRHYMAHSKLNSRQVLLLKDALENIGKIYTVKKHSILHNINLLTARKDLISLAKMELLIQSKKSREFIFIVPNDLKSRIQKYQK